MIAIPKKPAGLGCGPCLCLRLWHSFLQPASAACHSLAVPDGTWKSAALHTPASQLGAAKLLHFYGDGSLLDNTAD